ncbi:Acetyl xylan esterase (AXE1) [Crateriforma conspicua]|uniref:Acetyl xylan esterase (AXE1) n=1 Tax=Crateriforma conspicua TaxID=2527996 RepID=A0A5C6FVI5_9PLAN|nr:CocE/NonD family hydrolase [Crateriforma conspicua]TWU67102.1 Acetyl xylan esterase (AXE1) [Crateriforma conspicua]
MSSTLRLFVAHFVLLSFFFSAGICDAADDPAGSSDQTDSSRGDDLVHQYFAEQTRQIRDRCLSDVQTLDDWTQHRELYRSQLLDMLGLNPMPPRGDLQTTVTGQVQREGVVVEKIHFQSLPGLYVTGNLYRPAKVDEPLPAILYVCGHGKVVEDGVSYGNKVHYQHHGAWFARNGYVCLVIDTIQLGEIEGTHHGTYRKGMWWWNNRGYTPAGVEAWNCLRAIDLLQSRDDVDSKRIGVTGRSGGGVYSWWSAAIDPRIKVAVPVAGITNMKNHVVDGCVSGHCDCMYMVNTHRWDFAKVAALVAPRPLLISNTDRDSIFPLDGVVDLHSQVRQIYALYDAEPNLGLQITSGPHQDTQELRVHAFRWFNKYLRDDESLIESVARPLFTPQELKVFDRLPGDQRVTTIHETFVPPASADQTIDGPDDVSKKVRKLLELTFAGWPDDGDKPAPLTSLRTVQHSGVEVDFLEYHSQSPYRLPMVLVRPTDQNRGTESSVDVHVLDEDGWQSTFGVFDWYRINQTTATDLVKALPDAWADSKQSIRKQPTLFVAPRGVGPTQWTRDERPRTHIRRRFMLLGQTAAGMQIYDLIRALRSVKNMDRLSALTGPTVVHGQGDAAFWVLWASLFVDGIDELHLRGLPSSNRQAPDLLNVSRVVQLPHVIDMARQRIGNVHVSRQ